MHMTNIGIFGASGYAGIEATRILSAHPFVSIRLLASDRWANDTARARIGLSGAAASLRYVSTKDGAERLGSCEASEDYSFTEVDGDFRAYKVFKHQHAPEIEQTLSAKVTFTPHLLPLKRGILSTSFAHLRTGAGAAQVSAALADAYRNEPFI